MIYARLPLVLVALLFAGCVGRPALPPQGQDTLFLTWTDDPTTTMTIQWLTPGVVPPLAEGQAATSGVYTPRLDGITMDGDAADWAGRGASAMLLADAAGRAGAPGDLAATATFGWDERGLLVRIDVADDTLHEAAKDDELWDGDGIELFVSGADGSGHWQLIVSPGVDPAHPAPRTQVFDRRRGDGDPLTPQVAAAPIDGGYRIEALLPWAATGVDPAADPAARLQVYVNDRDAAAPAGRDRLVWYPSEESNTDAQASRLLRLEPASDGGRVERARGQLQRAEGGNRITLIADPALAGERVTLRAGDRIVARARLALRDGIAVAEAEPAAPPRGRRWGDLAILVGDETLGSVPDSPHAWASAPRSARIRYGLVDNAAKKQRSTRTGVHPFGESSISVHRAHLNELEPDTAYVFQIEGDSQTYRFRTAPARLEPGRPLVFAEGGDIGTGAVVPQLHDMAASWDPLFGLVGGDLAYANGKDVHTEIEFLRTWHAHMRAGEHRRLIPMLATIGNHEVRGSFAWGDRSKAPFFYSLFGELFKDGSYGVLDFGDYLSLVFLDTHTTPITDQTDWLFNTLAERRRFASVPPEVDHPHVPHVFPVYHVPAYPSVRKEHSGERGRARSVMRREWVPSFEDFGIRVAFEHDDHAYKRTHPLVRGEPKEGGVVYLGDGSWGRSPRPVHTDSPYLAKAIRTLNVIKVTLDGEHATFEAFDENREKLDEHRY